MRRLVLAVAVMALAACQQSKPGRIGIITALTGSQQAFGQAHDRGYEMALEEINASGGVLGKPLEIVKYDDQSKADIATQGVAKLVDQDKVSALIGSYSSESTKAIVPLVARRGVPLLMPTATADNVLENTQGWSFRLCSGATDYANAMVSSARTPGLPKSVAIVYENTNFGQANGAAMKKAATDAAIPIATEESYTAKSPSYTAMLQKVKEKSPDAIYFASYLLDATSLMHQSRQVDLNPRYFTAAGTGFSTPEFPTEEKGAGKDADYTFSVTQWMPESKWPGSAAVRREVQGEVRLHARLPRGAGVRGAQGDGRGGEEGREVGSRRHPRRPEGHRHAADHLRPGEVRRPRAEPAPGAGDADPEGQVRDRQPQVRGDGRSDRTHPEVERALTCSSCRPSSTACWWEASTR